jgi:trk system potassium uptake protein
MLRKAKTSGRNRARTEFAVFGLGHFGASLARRLEEMGHMVLGVDSDPARVQAISDDITSAVALDITNEDALEEIDIGSFGTVIIGTGDDFETTALVTAYLKSLGIARVICLAKTQRHRNILLRIGADQGILSDEDSGVRLAETLALPEMQEHVLLDADHSLTELKVPDSLVTKPVSSLQTYGAAVILIQRQAQLLPCPDADLRFEADDTVFVVGERDRLLQIASLP